MRFYIIVVVYYLWSCSVGLFHYYYYSRKIFFLLCLSLLNFSNIFTRQINKQRFVRALVFVCFLSFKAQVGGCLLTHKESLI